MSKHPDAVPRWKKIPRYAATTAVVAVLVAAAYVLLWRWPQQAGQDLGLGPDSSQEVRHQVQELENARVATGAQLFLGLGILVGIYLTYRRIRATEQQAESSLKQAEIANRQAQTAQAQVELGRRQQTAERFTKAIEQLGSREVSIRLGGIYALEKIAQDEPEAYFNQFREVLCAFVREMAREPPGKDENGEFIPLPTDLQVALTVLGRNPPPPEVEFPAGIDWSGAHLEGAKLFDAHLERANLAGTHLEQANLFTAFLNGSYLWETHLEGAELHGVHLENTELIGVHLEGALLPSAHLERAYLEVCLEGALLREAHLQGANLWHVEGLESANLSKALYNRHTKFPAGFTPPKDMVYVEDAEEGSYA